MASEEAPSPASTSCSCKSEASKKPSWNDLNEFVHSWDPKRKSTVQHLRLYYRALAVALVHSKACYDAKINTQCRDLWLAGKPINFPVDDFGSLWRNPNDGEQKPKKTALLRAVSELVNIVKPQFVTSDAFPQPPTKSGRMTDDIRQECAEKMVEKTKPVESGFESGGDSFIDKNSIGDLPCEFLDSLLEFDFGDSFSESGTSPSHPTNTKAAAQKPGNDDDHRFEFNLNAPQAHGAAQVPNHQADGADKTSSSGSSGALPPPQVDPVACTSTLPSIPTPGDLDRCDSFDFTKPSSFETKYPEQYAAMMEMIDPTNEEGMDTRSPPPSPQPRLSTIPQFVMECSVDEDEMSKGEKDNWWA